MSAMELSEHDWRPATLVATDLALDRGGYREVTPGEVLWVLESAQAWVHYYEFESVPAPDGSLFGINAAAYELWSAPAPAPSSPSSMLDAMKASYRELRYSSCPLYRCEQKEHWQSRVPISREPAHEMILIGTPGGMPMWQPVAHSITFTGASPELEAGDWVEIGDQRIHPEDLLRGDVVPHGYRIIGVDRAQRRLTLAADFAQLGLIQSRDVRQLLDTGRMSAPPKSRVPAHVQQHQRRLDGRRR